MNLAFAATEATAHGLLTLVVIVVVACLLAAFIYWAALEIGLPQFLATAAALLVFLLVLLFAL